jgi:hypothetical protein
MRTVLVLVLWSLCLPVLRADRAAAPSSDPDVRQGISQVEEGDYDGAILTLDNAARRLAAQTGKPADLSQAYLYLGIAYLGKGQEAAARARFREAIGQIKDLTLSPDKFAPKVIDAFEAAKEEASRQTAASGPTSPTTATKTSAPPEKKGGGHKGLLIGGLVVAGGAGVALAAGGGGSSGSTGTPLQTMTFTGTLGSSPQGYQIVATKSGTLTATLQWDVAQIGLIIVCQEHDPPYTACSGVYNRTSNTTGMLTTPVTQKAYDILVEEHGPGGENYTLTVTFP